MVRSLILLLVVGFVVSCSSELPSGNLNGLEDSESENYILEQGFWKGELAIDSLRKIPFVFEVVKDSIFFINAKEYIGAELNEVGNELIIKMPIFDSEFQLVVNGTKAVGGVWFNHAVGENYKMPFFASYSGRTPARFQKKQDNQVAKNILAGKWETTFNPNSEKLYKSVGLFEEEGDVVAGTFLTETGDYRFLDGVMGTDSLFLSSFDGSHAFLFEAALKDDSLYGTFYSGNDHKSNWVAIKNEDFELSNPDSLTRLNIGVDLAFELPSLTEEPIIYPGERYSDKVVIIQVMGSWCPNCMDETQLFTDMYDYYNEKGLEVIAIAFEKAEGLIAKKERVAVLKDYFNATYDFAIGGNASKVEAQKVLPALDKILSFPTAIFIDKKGRVRKVHTGFYGPGTGSYYLNYVKSTKGFIEKLLNE